MYAEQTCALIVSQASFSLSGQPCSYADIPPLPPSSSLGSLPWQGGQTSCDSAAVCRMHSAKSPPQHWTATRQTSVAGFPQHEKDIEPSARLKMACYCCPQTTSLNVTVPVIWEADTQAPLLSAPSLCSHLAAFVPCSVC